MTIELNDSHYIDFKREGKHIEIKAQFIRQAIKGRILSPPTSFIFDTGAMITTLTRYNAEKAGYLVYPVERVVTLGGVVPGVTIDVEYVRIPGFQIAGLHISSVMVAIPCMYPCNIYCKHKNKRDVLKACHGQHNQCLDSCREQRYPCKNQCSSVCVNRAFTNILGQNVLEYFKYFMDTENDRIYFVKNPIPKPISEEMACMNVFITDEKI